MKIPKTFATIGAALIAAGITLPALAKRRSIELERTASVESAAALR